ncbi:MAG: hypothetical protein JWM59_1391 [Verrucomicrobiales bacterium]|nr:hypothetical protein [Verrucomicrobiales bacterium]
MNSHELENLWSSPQNRPDPAGITLEIGKHLRRLRCRHRSLVVILSLAAVWLTVILVRLAFFVARGGPLDLTREWGAVAMLLLPLMALILLVRQFRRHLQTHTTPERSIQASLLALLDENRLARRRVKMITGLYAAVMLITPLVVHQLQAVGKAGDEVRIPAFVLLPLLLLTLSGILLFHHRFRLLPRHRELRELLEAYQ